MCVGRVNNTQTQPNEKQSCNFVWQRISKSLCTYPLQLKLGGSTPTLYMLHETTAMSKKKPFSNPLVSRKVKNAHAYMLTLSHIYLCALSINSAQVVDVLRF